MTNTLENLRSAGISAESPQAGRSEADRPPASRDDVAAFQRAMRGEADEARRKTLDERSAFSQKTGEGERTETSSRASTEGETARGARPDDAMMTDPDARKAQDFLASLFYMNRSYISQLFRRKTGGKFIDYLNDVRIEKACELLAASDRKIYQIARAVGYDNPKYFFRLFHKKTGVTPEEYRLLHRREEEQTTQS